MDKYSNELESLDKELDFKNQKINNLKYEINTKISAVDDFNDDELEKFFTERYRAILDSITKTNSKISN